MSIKVISGQATIVQEIIDYLNTEVHPIVSPEHWDIYSTLYDMVMCIDDKIALPAERHGYWIEMADFEQCSVCHGTHLKEFQTYYGKVVWVKTAYCPNCGARMDGKEEENATN